MMFKRTISFFLLTLLLAGVAVSARAQDSSIPQATFFAYDCAFDQATNTVQVRAALAGSDGAPLPPDQYSVSVVAGGQALPGDRLTTTPLAARPPMRLVIVFDATDTVPVPAVVQAIARDFIPLLSPEDEVALITFSTTVSPMTQFFTDKNRLINEYLANIISREGADNLLYDAILAAVNGLPPDGDRRQAVLVMTDSRRRQQPQATTDDIIARAVAQRVQIFNIAFFTNDTPDVADLTRISNATQGFTWVYNDPERTRVTSAQIGDAIGQNMRQMVNTLDTEVQFVINMQGVTPNDAGTVDVEITIDPRDERTVTGTIICPLANLSHSIAFTNVDANQVIQDVLNMDVFAQSDLGLVDASIAFWLDERLVQNSPATAFLFDAPALTAGPHTVRAQLRTRSDEVLAATPTLNVYVQRPIQLSTVGGIIDNLRGLVRFEALMTPDPRLPTIQFTVASSSDPQKVFPLGLTFAERSGRTVLSVDDIQAKVNEIFPSALIGSFEVVAFVPGFDPQLDPPLALSNPLTITIAPLLEPASPLDPVLLSSVVVSLLLVVFNLLLFRQAAFARVLKFLGRPDKHDLTNRLMTITVLRGGAQRSTILTKKTMFIGRGSFNDINLGDNPNVSRRHGAIIWRRERWWYVNQKSGVRTRINGRRYHGYAPFLLEPITEIEIGDALLVFHSNSQQDITEFTKTNL